MKVMLVEDDANLSSALVHILSKSGYEVSNEKDGAEALKKLLENKYDVIILDVMLPSLSGTSIARELRHNGISTPILMLTARDTVNDKIAGLDSGADDYMTKPFFPAELLAHLRALTRRQGEIAVETLSFADITLDLQSSDLTCGDETIHLSFKEFQLLRMLMSNPGMTVAKDAILSSIWGNSTTAENNNVEAYVSFVRKKLTYLNSSVRIETLRSTGYRLTVWPDVVGRSAE